MKINYLFGTSRLDTSNIIVQVIREFMRVKLEEAKGGKSSNSSSRLVFFSLPI